MVTIARVELGLTLYLDPELVWAREGVAKVLQSFLTIVPAEFLCWYSTSHMDGWRKFERQVMTEVASLLSLPWGQSAPRHLFEFQLTDDIECPSCGFRYREIDLARAQRAAVIEVTLPQEFDPSYLLQIARAALSAGPLWSAIGGYAARLGDRFHADAFDMAWAWAQRYRGIDIQDAERMAWRVPEGLPGVNWITILGASLAKVRGVDVGGALRHSWVDPFITSESANENLLIVAGDAPTVGDANRFEGPSAYIEVAHALRPILLNGPLSSSDVSATATSLEDGSTVCAGDGLGGPSHVSPTKMQGAGPGRAGADSPCPFYAAFGVESD